MPFAGSQALHPLSGPVAPGEHWCLAGGRLLGDAGVRLASSAEDLPLMHQFGTRDKTILAWCEVELDAPHAPADPDPDADLAASLRARGVDDATWIRDNVRLLEEHYLRAGTAAGQSGKRGSGAEWEEARRLVAAPIHHDGTFLDLGCANGLLAESVERWAAEDGRRVTAFGMDASARLVDLARTRRPEMRERFFVADALTWAPPERFDFVHTMPDLVPGRRRAEWLRRVLDEFVAPGGRLIVREYKGIGDTLRDWGLPVAGTIVQDRGPGKTPVEAAWLDAPN